MKINLLIVDDIAENLYALEVLLEDLDITHKDYDGINIFKALNGEEALRLAIKEKIDLILLDVRMPDMDGFQVAEFLKMSKKTAEIPIVFLTAEFKSEEFISKGYKVGGLDYFTKPIERFQFLNKMGMYVKLFLSQKIQEKEYTESLAEYLNLIDRHIITSDTDTDGRIQRVSQAFCDISGYEKNELIGKSYKIIRDSDFTEKSYKEIVDTISVNKIWEGQIKNRTKKSEYYWTHNVVSQTYDKNKRVIGYTWIEHNITNRKKLEKISITDGLTGIFNRRYYDEFAPRVINTIKRSNQFVCFSLIDIDYFKKYNDTYGHQMGDTVLKKVANLFKACAQRANDCCFRIGGEEFCIIFSADNKKSAYEFMLRIKSGVEGLKIKHAKSSTSKFVTISIGLTCKKGANVSDIELLFSETDKLLYEAKATGRNKVVANFIPSES